MNLKATFLRVLALLLGTPLAWSAPPAQQDLAPQNPDKSVLQIVAESQEALTQHDDEKALRVVHEGFKLFPNNEELQVQLARVYVYQKHDRQAMGLMNAILLANPSSRIAKLEMAEIYGYRENYSQSDRLYRELLATDPNDEAAALGLAHNLVLEGKKDEARVQVQKALERHPLSLGLQQYNDYLAASVSRVEAATPKNGRAQVMETYFTDTSGNRSFYSSQGANYQFGRNLTSRFRMEETRLWRTGSIRETAVAGAEELRYRVNKWVTVRASGGAIRFADESSKAVYLGELELHPVKNLVVAGGYTGVPVLPTFDAEQFDIIARGWRTRVEYRTRTFSAWGTLNLNHYSDGNHQEREAAEVLRWVNFGDSGIAIAGGYAFRHLHFAKDLGHGYFSPDQYRSHLAAVGLRIRVSKHYRAELMGYGGGEQLQTLGNYTPGGEFLLRNDFFLGSWDLGVDYTHYHLIQTTGAFRADAATIALGYRF